MPYWRLDPVEVRPQKVLADWSIRRIDDGTVHFVGYCLIEGCGSVSSPILQFDPTILRGISRSGRIYELRGRPGSNGDAEYVWNKWAKINDITSWEEISVDDLNRHLGHLQ